MVAVKQKKGISFTRSVLCMVFLLMQEFQKCSSVTNDICKCLAADYIHWTEGLKFCHSVNSSLPNFQHANVTSILNQTCLYGSNKYWTGKYRLESNWIDIIGCYSADVVINPNKTWNVNITHCFAYCHRYQYFGLREMNCVCFDELERHALKHKNSCVPCNNTNYLCGKSGYIAVYKDGIEQHYQPNAEIPLLQCLTVSCTSKTWRSFFRNCHQKQNQYSFLCDDNPVKNYTLSWLSASRRCMNNNTHLAGTPRITEYCKNTYTKPRLGQFWTYLHKEIIDISATTPDIFRDYTNIRCEYITLDPVNTSIQFGSCEEIGGIVCKKTSPGNVEDGKNCPHGNMKTTKNTFDTGSTSVAPTTENNPTMTSKSSVNLEFPTTENGNSVRFSEVTTHSVPKGKTTPPPSIASDTENQAITYIAVGCSVGVVAILVIVIIVYCKIRSTKTLSTKHGKKTESELLHINNNSYNKDQNNHTSSKTHKHKNSYIVPSDSHDKQQYDVIDIVDPKEEVKNGKVDLDFKATKPNAYSEPWSDDAGHLFNHKMVDDESTHPSNKVPNNQYSLVRRRGEENQDSKNDHETEFKRDNYDHINNVKVEYKKNNSNKDNTYDKAPINGTTDEDDYDQFERNKVKKPDPTSNYDHVAMNRKVSNKKENVEGDDDLEDYDHLHTSAKRPESIDSTYDHTHPVKYEDTYNHFNQRNTNPNSDTYDHLPNEDDDNDDDYATADNHDNTGDYEISDELPAVRVNSGNRDSYYTSVTLSDMDA